MVRNYVAKIALLVILRYVEQKNSSFEIDTFLSGLGEQDLANFDTFDKYPFKDNNKLLAGLKKYAPEDKAFFFRVGMEGLSSNIGSYSFYLQISLNLRDLITKSRQFAHVVSDVISVIDVEDKSDYSIVTYRFSKDALNFEEATRSANLEMSYGVMSVLFKEMTSTKDNKIVFHSSCSHDLSDDSASKLLGFKFVSGADQNYITIPHAVLDRQNPKYEASLPLTVHHGLTKHLENHNVGSLITQVSNLLEINCAASLEDISNQLHVSKRTLQRRLKNQNINFTSLKQNIANQKSLDLLDNNEHTIEEISSLLGYSSAATFVHAFIKWHGISPSAYLKQKVN